MPIVSDPVTDAPLASFETLADAIAAAERMAIESGAERVAHLLGSDAGWIAYPDGRTVPGFFSSFYRVWVE